MSLIDALKNVPFLSELTGPQLEELIGLGRAVDVGAGTEIFRAGDPADRMYVILSGMVRVFLRNEDGHEVELTVLKTGDFFGEMALLDGGDRSASVSSVDASEFFVLDREAFLNLLTTSRHILSVLLVYLTDKVRVNTSRYFQEELARQALHSEMEIERHRSLSQMVAGVAHEVNTPLGIVNTAVSIVRRGLRLDALGALAVEGEAKAALEEMREAVELMERHILRAHKLIQSFKNVSAGQIVDTRETLNLSETVSEILELFRINARKARLELEVRDALKDRPGAWVGYRGHLSRVLLNLLTNIERYAYPEGAGGRVEITLEADENRTVPVFILTVRDFGKGIAPDDLEKVFEPFFTTGRGKGGTGLGMAIVYNLVSDALKGRIGIESAPGEGTTVRVEVPQTVPD